MVLCDIASEPLPIIHTLQYISAVRVLKYMPNWWDVVRDKLVPQLAPGGVLVFSMPNRNSVKRFSRAYAVQYETTTEAELRARLAQIGTEVVEIAGFTKLPDLVHRRCKKRWSSRAVMAGDDLLKIPFGKARLATELFVAVAAVVAGLWKFFSTSPIGRFCSSRAGPCPQGVSRGRST